MFQGHCICPSGHRAGFPSLTQIFLCDFGKILVSLSLYKIRRLIHRDSRRTYQKNTWTVISTEESSFYEEKVEATVARTAGWPHLFEEPARLGDRCIGVPLHGV